jgi:hypothetical protein
MDAKIAKKVTLRRPQRAPKVKIAVIQDDINNALPKRSGHCMIADAVKRDVPGAKGISVDIQTIRWSDPEKGLRYTYLTPRDAAVALVRFDQGVKPKPFGFRLRGAQVTTMHRKEKGGKLARHKLGKKRLSASPTEKKLGNIPDVIGGRPPPRFGRRREFGMRGLSMDDVFPRAVDEQSN